MEKIIIICCLVLSFIYLLSRLKFELQMMQQNSYRNSRYIKWYRSDLSNPIRIAIFILFILSSVLSGNLYILILIILFSSWGIFYEAKKKYKKKLVFTRRATRLYITSVIISLLTIGIIYFIWKNAEYAVSTVLLLNIFSFTILIISNLLNSPIEKSINRKYYNEAKQILQQNKDLIIIGITGSYGKTSTKHYLYRILSEKYNVLMTPGSFNTTLGVIRTVREQLKPYHEIFIVEMGAKQSGDIKEICELVHPSIGIITSVGEQHLESFKTIENVQKTKFELIDSLPEDGLAVLNYDYPYIASRKVENVKNKIYYSFTDNAVDYFIDSIKYSSKGTEFTVHAKNGPAEELSTKIVGKYNLSNILAGYIVAKYLKIEPMSIKYAVSHIEQVEHRLNIRQTPGGITIIDDAFNSNPNGAEMALEVLGGFTTGKRIIITPGFIELGNRQFDYNYNLGRQITSNADYSIIVGSYNRDALTKGLNDSDFNKQNLYLASSFNDAVNHLKGILSNGDVVLYENDLPDTFK